MYYTDVNEFGVIENLRVFFLSAKPVSSSKQDGVHYCAKCVVLEVL